MRSNMNEEEDFLEYLRFINNSDAPLLSQTTLGARLDQIPLDLVRPSDLNDLTLSLSVEQLIPTERGLARDYRGLAELMRFRPAEIETRFKRSNNSTKSLIDAYIDRHSNEYGNRVSVNDLLKLVEQIERFDVIDDSLPILVEFASQRTTRLTPIIYVPGNSSEGYNSQQDVEPLTYSDTFKNVKINYDAFLCYAPQDIDVAQDLKLELERRGKRLATVGDLLPGHFEHDALMRLIELRCRKVILIVTRNFCNSNECNFQFRFASEVSINGNENKIIPLMYEIIPTEMLPSMIRYISKITIRDPAMVSKLIFALDYVPPSSSGDGRMGFGQNHSLNQRTSFSNGQLRPIGETHLTQHSNGGHNQHSYSESSPTSSRAIVELAYSEDSGAIRTVTPGTNSTHGNNGTPTLNGTTKIYNRHAEEIGDGSSSSSTSSLSSRPKKWTNGWGFFSSKKKSNAPVGSDNFNQSFASRARLIVSDSADLLTDVNIQSRNINE